MLSRLQLHPYQEEAAAFTVNNKRAALTMEMGLGKTISTLTAAVDLFNQGRIWGVLILAPVRVCETVWRQEAQRWQHTQELDIRVIRGTPGQRRVAISRGCTHAVNYEQLPAFINMLNVQFLEQGRHLPWNMLVLDEIGRVKNATGKRAKLLHKLLPAFDYRVGLNGTPAPNGYQDLFGQYLALDDGVRLGASPTAFKKKWFRQNGQFSKYTLKRGAAEAIRERIQDITFTLRTKDYLDMPEFVLTKVNVTLPKKLRVEYDRLEQDLFAKIGEDMIHVFSKVAMMMKARQFANGIVYATDQPEKPLPIHEKKLEALDDIVEEAAGHPVLVIYEFRLDMSRIIERYTKKGYRVAYLGPGVNAKKTQDIVDAWNRKEYHLLVTHPASAGHGMNLQHGSNIVAWMCPTWNRDHFEQMNARLYRQGQEANTVFVYVIIGTDTVDEVIYTACQAKGELQDDLKAALDAYRRVHH